MDGVNYVCHVNLNAQGEFLEKRQDSRVPYDKNSIKSVSYTHLDVYKRQHLEIAVTREDIYLVEYIFMVN